MKTIIASLLAAAICASGAEGDCIDFDKRPQVEEMVCFPRFDGYDLTVVTDEDWIAGDARFFLHRQFAYAYYRPHDPAVEGGDGGVPQGSGHEGAVVSGGERAARGAGDGGAVREALGNRDEPSAT